MAFERKMHDVSHLDLSCETCGKPINELPFMPSGDRPVYCRDCARKQRPGSGSGPSRGPREARPGGGERRMHDVSHMNLSCETCGEPINELPFMPSGDRPVYCRECARKQRPGSGRGGGGGGGGRRGPWDRR